MGDPEIWKYLRRRRYSVSNLRICEFPTARSLTLFLKSVASSGDVDSAQTTTTTLRLPLRPGAVIVSPLIHQYQFGIKEKNVQNAFNVYSRPRHRSPTIHTLQKRRWPSNEVRAPGAFLARRQAFATTLDNKEAVWTALDAAGSG